MHPPLVGGERIEAIIPLGYQPILDFTVERTHCYWTSGVLHHNTGKSELGALEMACHLTGRYPDWWNGRRFNAPVRAWAAGDTSKTVRGIVQVKLLGPAGQTGTGMIPADAIHHISRSSTPDAFDSVWVKHESGGLSSLELKSYEQGRKAFQGTTLEVIWLDEEPDEAIYTECLMRTITTNGLVYLTFTPLQGVTQLILSFLRNELVAA